MAIAERLAETLGPDWRGLKPLAGRYLSAFHARTRPALRSVVAFLRNDEPFQRACARRRGKLEPAQWTTDANRMQPVFAARDWPIPAISTVAGLAAWLNLSATELNWFADRKLLSTKAATPSPLQHYSYRVLAKPGGAFRLIEIPKSRLKYRQRQILHELLDRIPAHDAVHGFRAGRSIKTFATPHVGQAIVLRMDLRNFFPTFSAKRVEAFFRTAGYPEPVAALLTGLCTHRTPRAVFRQAAPAIGPDDLAEAKALYCRAHLPQGAPTSPALANCLSFHLDCRLAALAQTAGAVYTRYADDLAFSGDGAFARRAERFAIHVAAIAAEEGFAVHHRKTRIMRRGVRQHLAGVVVNERVNPPRADYDLLKAILTNCVRHGPGSQNREGHADFRSHLEGRVSFMDMLNPDRAARLRSLFGRIAWGTAALGRAAGREDG